MSKNINDLHCGKSDLTKPKYGRIIKGKDAELGEFPWMVSIQRLGGDSTICGAFIINTRWVLTAAHCLRSFKDERFNGMNLMISDIKNQNFKGEYYNLEKVIMNGCYSITHYKHDDIGLIRTDRDIQMKVEFNGTKHTVNTICLPQEYSEPFGNDGLISGWGRTAPDKSPKVLQKGKVMIHSSKICRFMIMFYYFGLENPSEANLCAFGGDESNANSCKGDSGSPLMEVVNGKVYAIGISSYGLASKDCMGQDFLVYTQVSHYINWIKNQFIESEKTNEKFIVSKC